MKILVLHNQYRNLGGEDIAVSNEIELLKKHYDVKVLNFSNNKITSLSVLFSFLTNSNYRSNKILKENLKSFKPDYVYIHNTWFKISLGIFRILDKWPVQVVLKLHNFRYDCTKSFRSFSHFKGEKFCRGCGLSSSDTGYINKYFPNSLLKSFFVLIYGAKYFRILQNNNLKILVLTSFHKNYIQNLGINKRKVFLHPNFINTQELINHEESKKENYYIYAGRISKEKGVKELITSFSDAKLSNVKLKIVGAGPLLSSLQKSNTNKAVEFLGPLSNEKVLNLIKNSRAAITATKLYEGQPTLLCEASSFGIPSVFPETGGIAEFFPENYIYKFNQFDYKDLGKKLIDISHTNSSSPEGSKNKVFIMNMLSEEKLINKFREILNAK
jgi:glycosyltransferase involved in cell wall biosynthesis